ncbi:hypothetical protein [Haloechinothrix halophila]|uniref:hypothetical protein n=1 Tax=Haloechinothrix halophila TaxID=1069073 RepID=UPI00040CA2D5|nr:hypothetical protein [Haloechinothrix halophila]
MMPRPGFDDVSPQVGAGSDAETLQRAIALVRAWRDPALPGLVFLIALAVTGGGAIAFVVFQIVGVPYVALQLPFVVSGALGGAALVMTGALLAAVLAERRDRVIARAEMREVVDELCAIVHLVSQRRQ